MSEQIATELNSGLPRMAAAVLHSSSPQGALMRNGKLPTRIEVVNGVPTVLQNQKPTLLASTAIYDGLAVLYNDAVPGAMLILTLPMRPTMGNLHRVLKGRGLVVEVDYLAYRAKFDVDGNKYPVKDRPLVLEKVSERLMKLSTGSKGGFGREIAAAARQLGQASPELTHARKKVFGKKSKADKEAERLAIQNFGDHSPLDDLVNRALLVEPHSQPGEASALDAADSDELDSIELPPSRIG